MTETSQKVTVTVQARDDGVLDWSGRVGGCEEWSNLEYMLKMKSTGLTSGCTGSVRERQEARISQGIWLK